MSSLAFIDLREGGIARARELFRVALELEQDIGTVGVGAATDLIGVAAIAAAENDPVSVGTFVGAYEAYLTLIEASHDPSVRELYGRLIAEARAGGKSREFEDARDLGSELPLNEAVESAGTYLD